MTNDIPDALCEPSCTSHRILAEPPGTLLEELTRVAHLVDDIATCPGLSCDPANHGDIDLSCVHDGAAEAQARLTRVLGQLDAEQERPARAA